MALSQRERFDRFVEKHGPVTADVFYWCSGATWARRRYCVVIAAKSERYPTLSAGLELRADTAKELVALMSEVGYKASPTVVARMCHAAELSPRRPTQRDNKRHASA